MKCDVIIPITERNFLMLDLVLSQLRKFIQCKEIYLVGKQELLGQCEDYACRFVNEDRLCDGLSYHTLRALITGRDSYAGWRTGWYLQQFLKMSYAFLCRDEYYLVWDADTVPLTPIDMFDAEGIPYFDVKKEYNKPYFTTLNKLFRGEIKKTSPYSYISEHMVIKTEYMRNLINEIEENPLLEGTNYFEKVINSIRKADLMHSGFSEFETYGNYVASRYPGKYRIRELDALRCGDKYLHYPPAESEIVWAANSYHIVTMENRRSVYPEIDENLDEYMQKYSLKELVDRCEK